jgi:hypothetical protein
MRKKLSLFILLMLSLNLFSQPTIRVFAFERENLPGTKPSGVTDENGKRVQKAAAKKNYFIFLSFDKAYSIAPAQIFIRSRAFIPKTTVVKKTPVQYINNNIPAKPEKITLVPATKNKVLELQLDETPVENMKTSTTQKLTNKNDVVIVYLWKNKKYFLTVKKLKKLEPVANE